VLNCREYEAPKVDRAMAVREFDRFAEAVRSSLSINGGEVTTSVPFGEMCGDSTWLKEGPHTEPTIAVMNQLICSHSFQGLCCRNPTTTSFEIWDMV